MPLASLRNGEVQIAYELVLPATTATGTPSGEPGGHEPLLVLTLGGISGVEASRKAARVIANRTRRTVLIWDRRNTGQSSTNFKLTHASINLEDVEDLRDLIRHVDDDESRRKKVILIGSSSGARVSLIFTHRYSSIVHKLVIAPPTGGGRACDILCDMYYNGRLKSKMMPYYVMKRRAQEAGCLPAFREAMRRSEEWLQSFRDEIVLGLTDEELKASIGGMGEGRVMITHSGSFQDTLHALETSVELVEALARPARHRLFLARDLLNSQLSSPIFLEMLSEFILDEWKMRAKL